MKSSGGANAVAGCWPTYGYQFRSFENGITSGLPTTSFRVLSSSVRLAAPVSRRIHRVDIDRLSPLQFLLSNDADWLYNLARRPGFPCSPLIQKAEVHSRYLSLCLLRSWTPVCLGGCRQHSRRRHSAWRNVRL